MTLPTFLIIGAPKAGTSSLYSYLQQHPDVYMSGVKEPHFFTFENSSLNFTGPGDLARLKGTVTSWVDYQKLFTDATIEKAIGEASTTYLGSKKAARGIKDYLPDVKLIVIIRNPADAAYASFLHLLREGDEFISDFSLALKEEPSRIASGWEFLWHYKNRFFYYEQFKFYFELFDRDRFKIYLYEDFKQNNSEIICDIYNFIGVDPNFIPDLSQQDNVSAKPQNLTLNRFIAKSNPLKSILSTMMPDKLRSKLGSMVRDWNYNSFEKPKCDREVREKLLQDYREDILKLQELLDKDLSIWLNVKDY